MVQMHKARSTRASAMAFWIEGQSAANSGNVRWQWESVNMSELFETRTYTVARNLYRLGGTVRSEMGAEDFFDAQPQLT